MYVWNKNGLVVTLYRKRSWVSCLWLPPELPYPSGVGQVQSAPHASNWEQLGASNVISERIPGCVGFAQPGFW